MAFNISYIISVKNQFSSPLKQLSAGVTHSSMQFKKMASSGGLVNRQLGKLRTTMKNHPLLTMGGSFLVFKQAFGTLLKFETSLNRLSAVTLGTTEDMARLSKTAKELGRTTAFTASQTAEAMTFLANAGFDTNEILKAIPATLELAAAGHMDVVSAARLSTNILDQMAMSVEELTRVNDVFAKTQSISNTNVEELAEAFRPVAPTARNLGFTIEGLAASLGIMASAGETGSISGTLLRNMLTNMSSPGKKAIRIYGKLGINMKEFVNQQGKITDFEGFIGNLEDLTKKGKLSVGMLQDLFGERGFRAAQLLIGKGSEELIKFRKTLQAAGGTAKNMADRQMAGLVGTTLRLSSAYEGFTNSLLGSNETGGAISLVIRGLTGLLGALTWINEKLSWVLAPIYAFIGALVVLRITTLAYTFASGQLAVGLALVKTAMYATTGGAWLYNAAATAATFTTKRLSLAVKWLWGSMFIPITVIAGGIYLIYTYWENIVSVMKQALNTLMFWKGQDGTEISAEVNHTSQQNAATAAGNKIQRIEANTTGEITVKAAPGTEVTQQNINFNVGQQSPAY